MSANCWHTACSRDAWWRLHEFHSISYQERGFWLIHLALFRTLDGIFIGSFKGQSRAIFPHKNWEFYKTKITLSLFGNNRPKAEIEPPRMSVTKRSLHLNCSLISFSVFSAKPVRPSDAVLSVSNLSRVYFKPIRLVVNTHTLISRPTAVLCSKLGTWMLSSRSVLCSESTSLQHHATEVCLLITRYTYGGGGCAHALHTFWPWSLPLIDDFSNEKTSADRI